MNQGLNSFNVTVGKEAQYDVIGNRAKLSENRQTH